MSDLELTKLCAQAMGFEIDYRTTASINYRDGGHVWTREPDDNIGHMYQPLHDDAQCFALIKKFPRECTIALLADAWDGDCLNRIVCECVAEIQTVDAKALAQEPDAP